MRLRLLTFLLLLCATLRPTAATAQSTYDIDFQDPASVLGAVFHAAREADYNILLGLCDPQGQGDGDTKQVCGIGISAQRLAQGDTEPEVGRAVLSFTEAFRDGRVTGKPVITQASDGTRMAEVDFVFGPKGERKEQMRLVERYGNWYLSSF
jgi:hypothetical protein